MSSQSNVMEPGNLPDCKHTATHVPRPNGKEPWREREREGGGEVGTRKRMLFSGYWFLGSCDKESLYNSTNHT